MTAIAISVISSVLSWRYVSSAMPAPGMIWWPWWGWDGEDESEMGPIGGGGVTAVKGDDSDPAILGANVKTE